MDLYVYIYNRFLLYHICIKAGEFLGKSHNGAIFYYLLFKKHYLLLFW